MTNHDHADREPTAEELQRIEDEPMPTDPFTRMLLQAEPMPLHAADDFYRDADGYDDAGDYAADVAEALYAACETAARDYEADDRCC